MPGFRDLADRLSELEGIPSRMAPEVAAAINQEIQGQFDSGSDPYGQGWKPLLPSTIRRKRGDARILRREDNLSSQTVARPTSGAGIEITSVDYGSFHQSGTKRMVARKILPDGAELPDAWNDAIEKAAEKAFKKALK